VDAIKGVDTSIKSVEAAIKGLQSAINGLASAQAAARSAAVPSISSVSSPSAAAAAGYISSPINEYGSHTGIGDSGYRLDGNTLYFPGGGSHTVSSPGGAELLRETYGLISGGLGGTLIRTRARGGYTPPGLTLVGEEGPELINFAHPGQVYTAPQTANIIGAGNAALIEQIIALREELAHLRAETRATARHTSKTASLLERAMPDGDALAVRETAL
jgi:hypothetical protein